MKHKAFSLVMTLAVAGSCGLFADHAHFVYLNLLCGGEVDTQEAESFLKAEIQSIDDVTLVESSLGADMSFSVILSATTSDEGDMCNYTARVTMLVSADLTKGRSYMVSGDQRVRPSSSVSTRVPLKLDGILGYIVVSLDRFIDDNFRDLDNAET
jgi:hypothetical protein